jgi:hypothetical protein
VRVRTVGRWWLAQTPRDWRVVAQCMSHDTGTAQRVTSQPTFARGAGALIALLAMVVIVLLAVPGSWSDYVQGSVSTVYPLMLLPAIAIVLAAGMTAACRPAAAHGMAVVSAITGLQVAGIAVVASRDWLNFAGADGASYQRGFIGSSLAAMMAVVAVATIAASIALYSGSHGDRQALMVRPGRVLAGVAVALGVPLLLCRVLHQPGVTAAGQFALWWSLPWGSGLVAGDPCPQPLVVAPLCSASQRPWSLPWPA